MVHLLEYLKNAVYRDRIIISDAHEGLSGSVICKSFTNKLAEMPGPFLRNIFSPIPKEFKTAFLGEAVKAILKMDIEPLLEQLRMP